jgi:hypothetical protein
MRRVLWAGGVATLALIVVWVANNTHWAEMKVPMPLKGEARTNPFYAAQRFADRLGARTSWRREFALPSADAVLVLSGWNWGVNSSRSRAVETWVEAGGRLVVDSTLIGGEEDFEDWSGIVHGFREFDQDQQQPFQYQKCRALEQTIASTRRNPYAARYQVCDLEFYSYLTTERDAEWTLGDASGIHVMRVPVGGGSVTVINGSPFRYRNVFDGDHGALFVAATELRRGDEILFLTEDDYPSLVALIWRHGAPAVVLSLAVIALLLWRGAVRFGPLAAEPQSARRSLAEQIRGTGRFLLRQGGAESLHAACVRALDEAAETRVTGYSRGTAQERAATLARLTGFDAGALMTAIHHPRMRRAHELRRTIALLEAARRLITSERRRTSHVRH